MSTSDRAAGAAATEPPVAWNWSFFLLGLLYALPAAIVIPWHPIAGLGLAIGVIPVAAFNLPGLRRGRRVILLVGVLSGAALLAGALLTQVPALGVVGVFAVAVGAALWAHRSRVGVLVLALCVPLVGIGLSFRDIGTALLAAGLVLLGSAYGWAVAMLWPEHHVPAPVPAVTPTGVQALVFGVLVGLAGATTAAIAYVMEFAHVGWAAGTALMIARPARDPLALRSLGRAASVVVGAFAAALLAAASPTAFVTALAVLLCVAALSATQSSRWFVSPAFTTFIPLTLLLQAPDARPAAHLAERLVTTGIAVAVALLFGAVVPAVIALLRRRTGGGRGSPAS